MVNVITRRKAAGIGAAGALLATLAMAPGAQAATYYACVKKQGGSIRIVSRSTRCRRSERKVSFNSEGLPGRNGLNGRNGQNGANGINGTNGTTGFTSTLPKGQTEEGTWGGVVAPPSFVYSPISFNIPLASAPASTIILAGGASTTACPGSVAKPSAISGHLCIYAAQDEGVSLLQFDPKVAGGSPGADTFGTIVVMESAEAKVAYGSWAVTG
jgi:hypothetical protein